jgi:hypothetical protein
MFGFTSKKPGASASRIAATHVAIKDAENRLVFAKDTVTAQTKRIAELTTTALHLHQAHDAADKALASLQALL